MSPSGRSPGRRRGESAVPREGRPWPAWPSLVFSVAVVLVTVVLVSGIGVGPVGDAMAAHGDEEDFAPPEVTNTSRAGTTTLEVRMSDNHDVDEGTIDASDFAVSPGTVSSVDASEDGTDATIEVTLEDGVGNQAVTIRSTNETDITDTNGNEFDPTNQFSEVVPAPDDPPKLHSASRVNASTIEALIVDDDGVDVETIDDDDFIVNRSSVEDVTATADGTNASVELQLASGTSMAPLLVGLADGTDIADEDGTVVGTPGPSIRVGGVSAPALHTVSKQSDTEVELYFVDDDDVAESSFQAHDFQVAKSRSDIPVSALVGGNDIDDASLYDYALAGVNATEDGSNATVVLELSRPSDVDELFVGVRDDAVITDVQGHEFDPTAEDTKSWEILDGMDGVAPDVEQFRVAETPDGTVELSIVTDERLAGLNVSVEGPVSDSLDRSAFSYNESMTTYRATYAPDVEGNVAFRLEDVTDDAGNTRRVDIVRTTGVDRSGPDPVVVIDFAASENLTLVFDGRHTTDLTGVSSYTWTFDDGTNATGKRATRTFEPGTHTVTLTAADPAGRTGTTSVTLDLQPGAGDAETASVERLDGVRRVVDPTVRVIRPGDGPADTALLEVRTPSPGVPVSAAQGPGEGLATGGPVTLEDVEMVPRRYQGFTLGLSASGSGSISGVETATDTRPVGGFTVVHDVPDADFESVTLVVSVDAGRLDELGASPSDLVVLRRQGEAWQRLETTLAEDGASADGRIRIRARSPGLSRFAVAVPGQQATPTPTPTPQGNASDGATPTPTPTSQEGTGVVVTNATLGETSVAPGTTVFVNATVENRAEDNTVYEAALSVNGTVVATEPVTLPAGERRSVSFRYVPNETGAYPVAVNGTSAGELTVGGGGLLGFLFGPVLGILGPVGGALGSVLGFLPLGLVRPLLLFVGLPVLVIFLVLKGLAIYLGY